MLAVVSVEWLAPAAWERGQVVPLWHSGWFIGQPLLKGTGACLVLVLRPSQGSADWAAAPVTTEPGFAFIVPLFAAFSLPFPWEQSYMLNNNSNKDTKTMFRLFQWNRPIRSAAVFSPVPEVSVPTCSKPPVVFRNVPEFCTSYSFVV